MNVCSDLMVAVQDNSMLNKNMLAVSFKLVSIILKSKTEKKTILLDHVWMLE